MISPYNVQFQESLDSNRGHYLISILYAYSEQSSIRDTRVTVIQNTLELYNDNYTIKKCLLLSFYKKLSSFQPSSTILFIERSKEQNRNFFVRKQCGSTIPHSKSFYFSRSFLWVQTVEFIRVSACGKILLLNFEPKKLQLTSLFLIGCNCRTPAFITRGLYILKPAF